MQDDFQIPRKEAFKQISESLADSPITALLGPRQCGKTWLARHFASKPENYFDLQNYVDRVRLEDSSFRILDGLEGTVVIDEAQLKPELFPFLRVLADRPRNRARFLITGSASPGIIRGVSESLAGRVRLLSLGSFTAAEVGWEHWERLWLVGGMPPSYRRLIEENSFKWRLDYISTFLARDLPQLVESKLADEQLRRFFQLLAHHHGQYWNHSETARTIGVNYKAVQRYVDLFKGAFLLRELPPYYENTGKRLRKAPKLYLRDTGLLHALLMLRSVQELQSHPRYGASWEGFCIEHVIRLTQAHDDECYTWSVQSGPEVDLVLRRPGGVFGFEFKVGDAPRRTPSMTTAVQDLNLAHLYVVYPGTVDYSIDDRITVVGFQNLERVTSTLR
jgi:hypothetical protein